MPLLTLFAAGSDSWDLLLLFLHLLPELLLQPLLAQLPLVRGITLHGQGVCAPALPQTQSQTAPQQLHLVKKKVIKK